MADIQCICTLKRIKFTQQQTQLESLNVTHSIHRHKLYNQTARVYAVSRMFVIMLEDRDNIITQGCVLMAYELNMHFN